MKLRERFEIAAYGVYAIAGMFLILGTLTGCLASVFRDKVEYKRVNVERYDPKTGRPRKMARIVDKRDIEVEYTAEDGTTWTEKHSLEGGNYSPPALPEPKAEIVNP
jgi:hypothetical protein